MKIFFNSVNVFLLFQNYLPLEKDGALNLKDLNPLHPRMLPRPNDSGEDDEIVKSLRQCQRQQ